MKYERMKIEGDWYTGAFDIPDSILVHKHSSNEGRYLVSVWLLDREIKCRECGLTPPEHVIKKAKFIKQMRKI